ncbi:MAG: hypothetical protein E6Q59_01645 [Nitrosomonas sp.]|nr:MAG: hypothetical protein E6Q59_01645 [Nitrosomonas sp.]
MFINGQAFLFLPLDTNSFHFDGFIAKRRMRTIEITLPGVFFHRPQGVFAVFLALVFIKKTQ